MYEIELKAHVKEVSKVSETLHKKRKFLLHFKKRLKKNNCKNPKRNRIFKR